MDYRLRLPSALYRRFASKAGSPAEEHAILVRLITAYVDGQSPASQFAAQGGRAAADAMTADQRRERAQRAVAARWRKRANSNVTGRM